MPYVEFSYNLSVHSTTNHSTFEVLYRVKPLTPLDLMPLPIDKRTSLDGKKKVESPKYYMRKCGYKLRRGLSTTLHNIIKGAKSCL